MEKNQFQTQPHSPKRTEKPWGYELLYAHTDQYVGKVLHINKGGRLSLQYHCEKDETIYLYKGEMDFQVEMPDGSMKVIRMKPGDAFHIRPGQKHRMIALEDCDVMEVSTPHLEDVVRVQDDYGRV